MQFSQLLECSFQTFLSFIVFGAQINVLILLDKICFDLELLPFNPLQLIFGLFQSKGQLFVFSIQNEILSQDDLVLLSLTEDIQLHELIFSIIYVLFRHEVVDRLLKLSRLSIGLPFCFEFRPLPFPLLDYFFQLFSL